MSPRRHGPARPFTLFARLFSAQPETGPKRRRSRTLPARCGLRLEALESRAMLSSMPFIAPLADELASKTASLVTVHGRYGNNALNGDWELGLTSNTSAPPQRQLNRTWNSGTSVPFTFTFTNTRPDAFTNLLDASFSIGGTSVQFDYGSQFASYEPNAIKIWARTSTANSGLTINDLKITTPGGTGETVFPGKVINVSHGSGTIFQEIIIAGIDFQSMSGGTVTLQGNVAMQFDKNSAPRGSSLQFHVIAAHIPWVDLDVNSNNDGGIDPRNGRSGTDDRIEDIAGVDETPGLYLQVQDEDTDGDGIVNWADGFNGIGDEIGVDDVSANATFAPLWVRIPEMSYDPLATLEISYSASDPSAAVMDPHYLSWQRPTDGHLRIWTKDAWLPRNRNPVQQGGDYVAPTSRTDRLYTLADLGLRPGDNQLFLEAIRESVTTGQQRISFRLTGRIGDQLTPVTSSDAVRVTTARIEVLADNRDGTAPFPTFSLTATRMPNPNAGLSGLVPDITQAYTINVYDPRSPRTIKTVLVGDTRLPLDQSRTGRYSTPLFLAVPKEDIPLIDPDEQVEGLLDGPLRPSDVIDGAIVVPTSGSVLQIRYNGKTSASRVSVKTVELADKFFWQVAEAVAKDMVEFTANNKDGKNVGGNFRGTPGRYDPSFSGAYGHEFEARLHKRFQTLAAQGNALAKRFKQGFIVDVNDLISATTSKDSRQIDVLFLREGYNPKVGDVLDKKQTIVYEVKTSFSGNPPKDQLTKLRPLSDLEVRSIHSNMRYMADGLGGFRVGPNTRFQAYVRAWKGLGAYVLKHTPEILIGTTVVVRAMSAEAAEREHGFLGDLDDAIIKAESLRNKPAELELQKTVVWDKIVEIMENRGVELSPLVKARVLQKILEP